MDGVNPYQAPRAALVSEDAADSYASALKDFASTRLIIRLFAIAAVICGGLVALGFFASTRYAPLFLLPALLYGVHGVMHWRLASRIARATANPGLASVGALLSGLRVSWLASMALLVSGVLVSAMPGLSGIFAVGGLSLEGALSSSASNEAARLRTVLRLLLAIIAIASVVFVWQQTHMVAPTPVKVIVQSVTAALLGAYGLLVWQQLAPLHAFIAAPSPSTLRPLARAHRYLWLLLFVAMVVVIACAVWALVMAFLFLPSELPDQR